MLCRDVYRQDSLGLCHLQGKETHQPKGCLCRYLRRNNCLYPTLLLKLTYASSAVESSDEIFPSTRGANETNEPDISVESNVEMDQGKKVEDLEVRLLEAEKELSSLRKKNDELERKITENEQHQETMSSRIFSVDRFKSDADVNFYTGLPNYATLISIFEFLNPSEDCENIRSRISSDVPEEFYNSEFDDEENGSTAKKGRRRKLRPLEEFFIVLCRLRRGLSERHLANLYGVAQSTISRSFIQWINFMYLKFGQICIWPSKAVVQQTMPLDFKEKFPTTRVVIDFTEVFCEMPSSLLLNSELFSSYKNHVTKKVLVGISPSGAITFVSQLYYFGVLLKALLS